jgi:hypothetical protein
MANKSATLARTNEANFVRKNEPNGGLQALWRRGSELEIVKSEPRFRTLDIPAISLLKNGLPGGTVAEIVGRRSSGRTACLLHVLAQATRSGEVCAVVDTNDRFDPASGAAAGLLLERLVWVRCGGNAEHAMRAADLLLHAGGFGVVALDFCETNPKSLNRIPLSYWFRFRRAIESTPTILLVAAEANQAKSCSLNILNLELKAARWRGSPGFRLLGGTEIAGRLERPATGGPQRLVLAG